MLLPLLLLLVCSSQASHFYGTVMTYYPQNTDTTGSITVVFRYKLNFHSCTHVDTWSCFSGDCGTQTSLVLNVVYEESGGEWCQREGIMTRQVPSNAPFQLILNSGDWISNIVNGISSWRAVTLVELRNRSDTGQANRSPQTTILPAVRVPSNCRRDFSLLAFDPDGDEVRCRNGNAALSECNPCTPPSVLTLSSSCTLSFSPTSSSNEGPYAVQLVMEDFPRQSITLTQTSGSQEVKTTNDAISKIPVQFVLRVDPAVPSCTEGLYLPKFLPPTPANGARLYAAVNQTLEIRITAEANTSTISELLFSGPHNINRTTSGTGEFILRWTPSEDEDGESLPICFVIQANTSFKYHSELRCVIVTVGNGTTITTTFLPTTTQQSTIITPDTTTTESTTAVSMVTTPATTVTTPDDMTTQALDQSTTITTTSLPTMTQQSTIITPDTTTTESTTAVSTVTTPVTTVTTPGDMTNATQDLNQIVLVLRVRISSLFPLTEEELRGTVIQQLKRELVRYGLPSDITLRLVSSIQLEPTNTATSAVVT